MASSRFALRFLSGRLQGEEYALPDEGEVVVGRASGLELVLLEDMVSRQHAKISVRSAALSIRDLGSTNGTFVNGEKVQQARLREGDRVLIGTSILRVVTTDSAQPFPKADGLGEDHSTKTSSLMKGQIEDLPVPDLLQLFSSSRRSGILVIRDGADEARVRLRDGNIFHAGVGPDDELDPMKALCRIVGWTRGEFRFEPPGSDADFMLELEDSTENLLVQATHQLDEFRRIRGELPGPDQRLVVPRPLEQPLSQLDGIILDIFQLAHNLGGVPEILDVSPTTDYETGAALLSLMTRGYLVAQ
jgi:hypothetical protein